MRSLRWWMACLVLVGAGGQVFGHGGHSHESSREWKRSDSTASFVGTYVTSRDGVVQIRKPSEELISIPIVELSSDDQSWVADRLDKIRRANEIFDRLNSRKHVDEGEAIHRGLLVAAARPNHEPNEEEMDDGTPGIAAAFDAFVKKNAIKTRWDQDFFYVESNGIPDHAMMAGITSWQQQVPLPQSYFGTNAWQIPLHPKPAKNPKTTKNAFLRGAIAIAVNGIPIFNPLNNRGDDAYLFGELDEFGGHCGRADDYHYHIAPVHLQETVGKTLPIAYALDGYPIYGYTEPDGSVVKNLDSLAGHKDADGNYHYHATPRYPYLNAGFYGEVTERGGQVDPQPRAEPVRPSLQPLRGAKIVGFQETKPKSFELKYDAQGKPGFVRYAISTDSVDFEYVDTNGKTTRESYSTKRRGPPPPPPRNRPAPPPPPRDQKSSKNQPTKPLEYDKLPKLTLTSSAIGPDGRLPAEFTCDGKRSSPPIAWADTPEETKSYAISLWHTAPDQEKSYWLVYNIPGDVKELLKDSKNVGTFGVNDKKKREYDPMCSKGPGVKEYHITVFALSSELEVSSGEMNRKKLLDAVRGKLLATGTFDFTYERK